MFVIIIQGRALGHNERSKAPRSRAVPCREVQCPAKQNRSASTSPSVLSGQVPSLHFKKFRIFRNLKTNSHAVVVGLGDLGLKNILIPDQTFPTK